MNKQLQRKLSASTLPEVLISMIVIMTVFTVAITIYVRITSSGVSLTNKQIDGEMNRIISQSIQESDWKEENIIQDSIEYRKAVFPYIDYQNLFVMQVTAFRNEEALGKMRRVVRIDE